MPEDDADLPRPDEGDRRGGRDPRAGSGGGRSQGARSGGPKGGQRGTGSQGGPKGSRDDRRTGGGKGSRDDRRTGGPKGSRDDRRTGGPKGSRDDRRTGGGKGSRDDRRTGGGKGSRDDRRTGGPKGSQDDRRSGGPKGSRDDRRTGGGKGSRDDRRSGGPKGPRGDRRGSDRRAGRSEPSRGREDAERRRQERAAPPDRRPIAPLPPGAPGFADPETEIWIDEGPVRAEAERAVRRGGKGRGAKGRARTPSASGTEGRRTRRTPPPGARDEGDAAAALVRAVGPDRGARLLRRLGEAGTAFGDERFQDAVTTLRPIAREAPSVPEVRELLGLSLYRLGRWKAAAEELEAFRGLTGSTEQHPVLADCYRAQRRWSDVEDLWEELRAVSPSAALVTEGRIVAAGALADQGRLPEALALLRSGWRLPSRAQDHHLRRAYALADLEERAGDVPRARELFAWVAATEPGFADVDRRLDALG